MLHFAVATKFRYNIRRAGRTSLQILDFAQGSCCSDAQGSFELITLFHI